MINVQCAYTDDDAQHLRKVLIPNLKLASKRKINFLCLNHRGNDHIENYNDDNLTVIDMSTENFKGKGFAENHNFIFNNYKKTNSFVLINPDCIPLPGCIDHLIEHKVHDVAIVEGRQWPFEHPKEYDCLTFETPWASFAFCLIDSNFYTKAGGMEELYLLYCEDVDLSWRAWLMGYRVIYAINAQVIHYTGGYFADYDVVQKESFLSLRNFIAISYKFFGDNGEQKAINMLKDALSVNMFSCIYKDYQQKIKPYLKSEFSSLCHKKIKILGINKYANTRENQ